MTPPFPPDGLDSETFLRARLAWNVRLAVAFENKGRRYLSSNAWNHLLSSPVGLSADGPASADAVAIGSTSPSDSRDSDDPAENALLLIDGLSW